MGSTSTVSCDEEFMEDLITLSPLSSSDSDCELVSVSENKTRPEIKKKPHSNEQEKPQTASSYGKGDFYLPARFFDISRNKSLLARCRAMSVSVVDCGKFPEFYRKKCGVRKPRPKSKQTYTLQNLLQDMSYEQKLKQIKCNIFQNLLSEYKNESNVVGQVNLTASKLPDVDFKKNIGLVGLKIERKLVGLVFKDKSKEDKKHKSKQNKHTADKPKSKTLENKDLKNGRANDISIENNDLSKEQAKPSELMIGKSNKVLSEQATSLKCSLNLKPFLSTTIQQKLLEMTSKSVQQSVSSSKETVQLLSSNIATYSNKTIIGQRVKDISANTKKVSIGDSVSGKSANKAPEPKVVSNKNSLPSSQHATITNDVALQSKTPENTVPEELDLKTEVVPNEVSEPEVHIKSEPEIKQELKDDALATDKMVSEDPKINMAHPNPQVAPVSLSSPLRSFRKSTENTEVTVNPIEDLRQVVGQNIPVQTTTVSDPNIENWQWHRYDEAGFHQSCAQNCLPSFNSTFPQTQRNVTNPQVTDQNIGVDSLKPKVGDLKVQTVSQINNSVVKTSVPAPGEPVSHLLLGNDVQCNELYFHPNDQLARSTMRGPEMTIPGPKSPLLNSGREKKIVRIRNTHIITDQNRHVAVGPYTVPPPYGYGYQPLPPHWAEHSHLANRMPTLMQQLNQRQRPMHPHPYWDPASNQEYFYRSVGANLNQAYDVYRYYQWNRPPPPRYSVEPRMKYVPPYQRVKVRAKTYPIPNTKPNKRSVTDKAASENTAFIQVSNLTSVPTHTPPLCPQSPQGVNDNNRVLSTPLPTCPTPSASVTSLPILSTPPPTLSVPQPDHEVHAAEILYPNTTFSEESSTSHVIYTESSNLANHESQQKVERCLTQIKTIEMTQTPTNFPEEVTMLLDMPLLDSFESDVQTPGDTASNSLSFQPKVRQNLQMNPTAEPMKPNYTSNIVPSSHQQANNNTHEKSKPNAAASIPNNTANNVLSSEPKARHSTPIKSDPKTALNNQNDTSIQNDTANNVSSSELQVTKNIPVKSKPTTAPSKPNETANNMFPSQRLAQGNTPTKSKPATEVSKPNNTHINLLSCQQQAKNNTPVKFKHVHTTLRNTNSKAAPVQIGAIKNVPKKRPYIPSDTKMSAFEGTANKVCDRSVPAVLEKNVNKGYSPPILPIPTVQKSLEILALVNAIKPYNQEQNDYNNGPLTPVKQSGFRNNIAERKTQALTPRKIIAPICDVENSANKRKPDQTPQSATKARKISIDEYKKRQDSKSIDLTDDSKDHKNKELSPTKDKSNKKKFYNNNENRGVDFQDLGYDSDPPSKF